MYNMSDYRAALSERGNYDMDSADWKLAQQKVQSIVAVLVAAGAFIDNILSRFCVFLPLV